MFHSLGFVSSQRPHRWYYYLGVCNFNAGLWGWHKYSVHKLPWEIGGQLEGRRWLGRGVSLGCASFPFQWGRWKGCTASGRVQRWKALALFVVKRKLQLASLRRKINEVWVKRDQECWCQQALAAGRDPEQTTVVDTNDNRWNYVLRGCHHLCCCCLLDAIWEIISMIFLNC